MKKIDFYAGVLITILGISSCSLDPGNGIINPKNVEPLILNDRYDQDVTLLDHNDDGVDYIATGEIEIYNGKMTIEPGVTIQFEEGASFNVGIDGRLDAVGSATAPIRMIAKENNPSWAGIYINTINANKIHHVQIENAGVGRKYGVYNEYASAITIDGKVSIENTTISKSGQIGLKINDSNNTEISSFSGNTIKDCTGMPMVININSVRDLELTSNIFADNGINMIGIEDEYNDRLFVETEFDGLEIPYLLMGKFEIYSNLTLNRGVEFVMDANSVLLHEAGDDYKFEINGTEDDHVVIRGLEAENGYWQGISIESENNGNEFNYLDISDGGGNELTFANLKANISIEFDGSLMMNNCTSARSGDCEIVLSKFGGENFTFVNNSPAITKVCEE